MFHQVCGPQCIELDISRSKALDDAACTLTSYWQRLYPSWTTHQPGYIIYSAARLIWILLLCSQDLLSVVYAFTKSLGHGVTMNQFPPEYLEANNGGRVIVACSIILAVSTILSGLRFYARGPIGATRGWDDFVLIPAYILLLGLIICVYCTY